MSVYHIDVMCQVTMGFLIDGWACPCKREIEGHVTWMSNYRGNGGN